MISISGLKNLWGLRKRFPSTLLLQLEKRNASTDTELQNLVHSSAGLAQTAEQLNTDTSNHRQRSFRRYTSGWRFGAITCALSASLVFLINLVVTIWGSVHKDLKDGVLFHGDCERARQLNTLLHLAINILSTILLSSSNYCMQILSAPTRKEVDEAHAKGQWLDIGVLSIRNLRRINRRRVMLYNSAVFLSISANNYWAINVSESFIKNPYCSGCVGNSSAYPSPRLKFNSEDIVRELHQKAQRNKLERLSNADCIREYAQLIQSTRKHLFLVSADAKVPTPNTTAPRTNEVWTMSMVYDWICTGLPNWRPYSDRPCNRFIGDLTKASENWKVHDRRIDYCLSEKAEPHCEIHFTLSIAILVTLLNFFKAGLIFYTAFGVTENPLLTMGDAVVSYLTREDETTKGMCLVSAGDVKKYRGHLPFGTREWKDRTHRWKDATSRTRRLVTFAMLTLVLIIILCLLIYGLRQLPQGTARSIPATIELGFGAIDPRTVISWGRVYDTLQLIFIANIAQPILSFLYFSYNGLFTAMLMGYEWVSYATSRKGLRVSRVPRGSQRSTYFLELPYRFALPLMVLSSILHWLVSQSLFLVVVDVYDLEGGRLPDHDLKSCGYSPIAIFTTLIVGIVMTLVAFGVGWIPYKKSMAVAGSCSAAISAACHSLEGSEFKGHEAARSKLQWGAVGTNAEGVGHCAFSTKEVEPPQVGQLYA
ncbi:hypothetical protein DM02DRAFT_535057 [Periconia macrospinosa]|uniref:DUF6536 domain-containing protein n=1 Tax=Periconia macrospinosa TaxID=97972 RepID=A0A2V1DER4_9PLEO|nr:hypothetical protein DM02DRAFT_535057 [Periconia macrospinosa]